MEKFSGVHLRAYTRVVSVLLLVYHHSGRSVHGVPLVKYVQIISSCELTGSISYS